MKVVSIAICLMFLTGCSGIKPSPTIESKVQQTTSLDQNKHWLPTHRITTQEFVFRNGKVCTINSLADAYCTSPKVGFSLKPEADPNKLASNTSVSPLFFGKPNSKRELNYLMDLEENTSLEYSLGRRALMVSAKHKF